MSTRRLFAFGLAMAGGCHMIGGTADLYIDPALETSSPSSSAQGGSDSVASTTTTGGGQGAGEQGGGGAGPMGCIENTGEPPTMWTCPEPVTDCLDCEFDEDAQKCVMDPVAKDTLCDDDGGKMCDGGGQCVQCTKNADCTPGVCQDYVCHAATCDDLMHDPPETDVDCGGPDCAPCDNGQSCVKGEDCKSTLCESMKCAPCDEEEQDDCAINMYCEKSNNHCTPKKPSLGPCANDYECQTGTCCESAFQDYCKGLFCL
jgi:hypothetical protein